MPTPSDTRLAERIALEDYSRRDATAIAPFCDLQFEDPGNQPTAEICQLAERALVATGDKVTAALEIGAALSTGDSQTDTSYQWHADRRACAKRAGASAKLWGIIWAARSIMPVNGVGC